MSLFKNLSMATAGAAIIALETVSADSLQATTLTSFQTFGDEMTGMVVTVDFLGGGSQTATWGATGSNAGGASGTNWSLTESGDTFDSPWTFSNSGQSITSLKINAVPGNTLFDVGGIGSPSTPGSSSGNTFGVQSGAEPDSFAYSVPIDISVGDLFGTLSMNYNSGFTGTMTYESDTDSGTVDDPVTIDPTPDVPNVPVVPGVPTPIPDVPTPPTEIPFEFSPSLGILLLGGWGAVVQINSLMQKRKSSGSAIAKN